jgi:hypothetical protein
MQQASIVCKEAESAHAGGAFVLDMPPYQEVMLTDPDSDEKPRLGLTRILPLLWVLINYC